MNRNLKIAAGFLLLFLLYHGAEYFVLFQNKPLVFLAVQVLFFLASWLLARWQNFEGQGAWGLDTGRKWLRHLVAGMVMGMLLYGVTYAVSLISGSEVLVRVPTVSQALPQLSLFCFGVFFSSFSEDLLTRGYLFKHFGDKMPPIAFVLFSAAVYLLNHIYRLGSGWETCTYLFMLGVLFALPLVLSRRLWFTGGMHWMGNTVYYLTHTVITTDTTGRSLRPNSIFILWILFFIPVVVIVLEALSLRKADAVKVNYI